MFRAIFVPGNVNTSLVQVIDGRVVFDCRVFTWGKGLLPDRSDDVVYLYFLRKHKNNGLCSNTADVMISDEWQSAIQAYSGITGSPLFSTNVKISPTVMVDTQSLLLLAEEWPFHHSWTWRMGLPRCDDTHAAGGTHWEGEKKYLIILIVACSRWFCRVMRELKSIWTFSLKLSIGGQVYGFTKYARAMYLFFFFFFLSFFSIERKNGVSLRYIL